MIGYVIFCVLLLKHGKMNVSLKFEFHWSYNEYFIDQ